MAKLSIPKTRINPMRMASMQFGRETFSGRNQVSDPLRSEAPPSSKKLSLKTNWRKWQKYQLGWLRGKNEKISKSIDQLFVRALVA
jgi:hypothetical protein